MPTYTITITNKETGQDVYQDIDHNFFEEENAYVGFFLKDMFKTMLDSQNPPF